MTAITQAPAPPAVEPTTPQAPQAPQAWPRIRLTVEYWTVAMQDQDSCGACDATLTTLRDVVAQIRPPAERLGITVDIATRAVADRSRQLGDYLTLGGPAPHPRQYLHAEPGADAPVTDASGCCSDSSAEGPR